MNLSAVTHESTLPFRQPLARNIICFRMLAAAGDVSACSLFYWKRSEPYPESRRVLPLAVRYQDGIKAEWVGEAVLPEEAHYLKYFFKLTDAAGASVYYSEHGFSKEEPGRGFFELLQAAETDVRKTPQWARGCVYYQIFPERFAVGNPNKELRGYERWDSEPTRENFLGGDLRGIREKLAYLEELGVECLYLNPVFAADFNHKYATTDYFAVDPDFGTTEDLTALVREAHSRGIRVLLDGVFNHVGVHFAPFLDLKENGERSKYRDWFYPKRFPIELDPGCYECVGDYPYMPRLRVANPEVRAFVLSVLLHWLDTADIDGWDIQRKLIISANIAFDAALEETAIPTFGIRTVTAADIAAFQSHGFACKLLARAESTDSGVCAYVEPTLVDAGDLEAAVPANFNLITYEAEQLGRQSFYGQGAGRFPTAENVVQDCLTVLSGKRGFYTDRAVPMFLTSGEAHPYYVRTSAPDAFLRDRTAETWDNGAVITGAVDVYEMLAWAKAQREKDPGVFIAGIR